MVWKILCGVDRSGKSTVAELYRRQGFEVVHFSAPDKKYTDPGYAGPSYLDDMLDLYMHLDGKDVVFDRSIYGEIYIWPQVFNRISLLSEEDAEVLQEFESRNSIEKVLMLDPDKDAHWQRCVDNKEPLNIGQFKLATALYEKMAHTCNFSIRQLDDYDRSILDEREDSINTEHKEQDQETVPEATVVALPTKTREDVPPPQSSREQKLEKANAIKSVLSKKIVKQKGEAFDVLELDIREFLDNRLNQIFGTDVEEVFSTVQVEVLKEIADRLIKKQGV